MLDLRIFLGALALALVSSVASADVPPPPGRTRVHYVFQIDAVPDGLAAVAFPGYNSSGGRVITLQAGKDVRSFQGYQPGIYVLPATDAAALSKQDDAAVQAHLDAHAKRCLKQIPRVFEVDTATKIVTMTDFIHLDATAKGCEARLVRTIYEGAAGERGEGGMDASGKRTPPAPFGADLPDVKESGLVLTAVTPTPTQEPPAPPPTPTQEPATPPTPTKEPAAPPPTPTKEPAAPPPEPAKAAGGCSVRAQGDRAPALLLLALSLLGFTRRRA